MLNKTINKTLIQELHKLGLTIPYTRAIALSNQLGNAAIGCFTSNGHAFGLNQAKSLFTTGQFDNLDKNTLSNTSITSFQGTAISLI